MKKIQNDTRTFDAFIRDSTQCIEERTKKKNQNDEF